MRVAPIRVALGLLWLGAARVAGAHAQQALLLFLTGGFAIVFLLANDPRRHLRRTPADAGSAPAGAVLATPWQQALRATLPSTAAVSLLAAVAVGAQPALAALLGGVSAGLGVGGLLAARRVDPALHVDLRSGVVYRR